MENPHFIDLTDVFKRFDPLSGQIYGQERLNDIARRARGHLAPNRSVDELRDGVGDIKGVIAVQVESLEEDRQRDADRKIQQLCELMEDVEWQERRGEQFYAPDEYFEYRNLFEFDLHGVRFKGDIESLGFPAVDEQYTDLELFANGFDPDDVGWQAMAGALEHEYYALFALWKLDLASELMGTKQSVLARTDSGELEVIQRRVEHGSELHLWRLSAAKDLAIEAMDAVCKAEHLRNLLSQRDVVEVKIKSVLSDRARQAARQNKRHQEIKQLKSELINWYLSHYSDLQHHSNEKVAELGLKVVPLSFRAIRDTIASIKKTVQSAS
jgi:hypothetical protein